MVKHTELRINIAEYVYYTELVSYGVQTFLSLR